MSRRNCGVFIAREVQRIRMASGKAKMDASIQKKSFK